LRSLLFFQTQYPDVPLSPLFTGSTILGIVVGLALQETLGNLFAGIAMQADQPFQVGDVIAITNRGTGVVESVSWRGVKVRTFQNKLLIVSNAVLAKEMIEVAPKGNLNARIVFFNTVYNASPANTIHRVREAVRQVENVSPKLRPVVRVRNLGDNGIDWK
jgi:small-conductance mechanosensitive channel